MLTPKVLLAASLAFRIPCFGDDAAAAQYRCKIPLAVLCPGCASDVTISLQPRGECRVSFTPLLGGAAQPLSGAVTFQIRTPAPTYVRHGIFLRARRAVPLKPANHSCFVFNDRQYCE